MITDEMEAQVVEYIDEFTDFMNINSFPQIHLFPREASLEVLQKNGVEFAARANYFPDLPVANQHVLTISTNIPLLKYVLFHEFVHILDTEMLVKSKDVTTAKCRFGGVHGYTEYHASQIELLLLLGARSSNEQIEFSMKDIIHTMSGKISVQNYIDDRHLTAKVLFCDSGFPQSIASLGTALGVLFNYWGLRSICRMHATDYEEIIDNEAFLNFIPSKDFSEMNRMMNGWLTKPQIESLMPIYVKTILRLQMMYNLE